MPILRKNSLSFRIVSRVLLVTITLFVLLQTGYYYYTRIIIQDTARENATHFAGNLAGRIALQLEPMEKIPQMLGSVLEMGLVEEDSLARVLARLLEHNPNVTGISVAFEPDMVPGKGKYFMPYAYRDQEGIKTIFLGGPDYEYFYMDWYQIPHMLDTDYWSEPYYDEGGRNMLLTTYSAPFYTGSGEDRHMAGIATVDVDLNWLNDMINEVKIFETGYAFVMSRNAVAVAHPDRSMVMNESIFSYSEIWQEPLLREIGRDMMRGVSKFRPYNLKGKPKRWIYYMNLSFGGWSLAVVFPEKEMYASLHKTSTLLIILIMVGLIILVFSTVNTVKRLSEPLTQISDSARMIAGGNFNAPLPDIRTQDELLELRNAFGYMQVKLAEYVEDLKETTTAKEKIESELRIARDIQMSMIPHSFPPFPDLPQVDLYAELKSAKEVGGDLYDFFLIDDDKFCFAIGDVSGKGVPASLFMAVTRTLLRSIADKHKTTSAIIRVLNESLTLNNDSCMFVTFFLGILHLGEGKLTFSNAGHNPPVMVRKGGQVDFLEVPHSIPLGLQEKFQYTEAAIGFNAGDMILAYTDGVSEAESSEQVLFGEAAILETVRQGAGSRPKALIEAMDRALEQHVKGYVQSDDITMICVTYNG